MYGENAAQQTRPKAYEELRRAVLRRDGWRCQSCGSMSGVEIHHLEFRSHGGCDSKQNLITVFRHCHNSIHSHERL